MEGIRDDGWDLLAQHAQPAKLMVKQHEDIIHSPIRTTGGVFREENGPLVDQQELIDCLQQTIMRQEEAMVGYRSDCSQLACQNRTLKEIVARQAKELQEKSRRIELCGSLLNRDNKQRNLSARSQKPQQNQPMPPKSSHVRQTALPKSDTKARANLQKQILGSRGLGKQQERPALSFAETGRFIRSTRDCPFSALVEPNHICFKQDAFTGLCDFQNAR